MKKRRTLGRLTILGLAAMLLSTVNGCFTLLPANALWGTWELGYEDDELTAFSITFNRYGDITFVSYRIGDGVAIPVYAPIGETSVVGNTVTITVNFDRNALIFVGDFNEDQTAISGTLTTVIFVGNIPIGSTGSATLTRPVD